MPAKVSRLKSVEDIPAAPPASALVVRYGGFGDLIVASAVFAGLKIQRGLNVVVNTQDQGLEILTFNPFIDHIWWQPRDMVANRPSDGKEVTIEDYWRRIQEGFDYYLNLSESVEASLLAYPGKPQYAWPRRLRNSVMNVNYLERTLDLAGLDHHWAQYARFYPTKNERENCIKERQALGVGNRVVLWSLSGSAAHKAYPHTDEAIGNILAAAPNTRIITVGDEACKILEFGLNKESRVLRRSGKWSIRKTLAMAQAVDVVVGTETGVLNAVGMEDVRKVIMLSHSTTENLTKLWKNTVALTPDPRAWCYPCHKMHLTMDTCPRDPDTRASICTQFLDPRSVSDAVLDALREVKR
jgi:ADP-heptose:LPS heptosyltransferase